MYFTNGSSRAFEMLMRGKPGFDRYENGGCADCEDCNTCHFYRPHWKYQFCVYAECPYEPGKLTALLWSDLDIADKTISVSKQYVKNPNGELTLSRPKTETSVRKVSIPQEAVDLLVAEHKKHPGNPYMFPSPITGEMYYPDSIVNLHKKILKDAGLPHIRFHDLRHTFATLALQNGVDVKTVSSMLGHYNAGFTLRTYTHATRQKQDEAAQTMGSFMAQVM